MKMRAQGMAALVMLLTSANFVDGADYQFDHWTDNVSQNAWNGHLQLPPTFSSPVEGWVRPVFATEQSAEYSATLQDASWTAPLTPTMIGPCGAKECVATDQCESLDPVMAEIIAKHRRNSPVARFCENVSDSCLPEPWNQPSDRAACTAAACSPPLMSPAAAPPMYAPAAVYVHPPIYSQPMPQPMPLAMAPRYAPPIACSSSSACTPGATACCTDQPAADGCDCAAKCRNAKKTCCRTAAACCCTAPACCCTKSTCCCAKSSCCAKSACCCAKPACCCIATACNCPGNVCNCWQTCQCAAPSCPCVAAGYGCIAAPFQGCPIPVNHCPKEMCEFFSAFVPAAGVVEVECEDFKSKNGECDDVQARLEHMLEASRHMALAGMNDQADELREQCLSEVGELMRRLKAAESEVARLRSQPGEARAVNYDAPADCPLKPDSACCKEKQNQDKPIVVHVQMLEINRTKLKETGLTIGGCKDSAQKITCVDELIRKLSQCSADQPCGTAATAGVIADCRDLQEIVQRLCKEGFAKILSEPTVMVTSGRAGSFVCGGEFPVPVPQQEGKVSVEYKRFGTELDLMPIFVGKDRLRLEMRARYSELDLSGNDEVDGRVMPGLVVRQVDTAAEMKNGQTLVVCGSVERRTELEEIEIPTNVPVGLQQVVAEKRLIEKPVDVELLLIVRPEVLEASECPSANVHRTCTKNECAPCPSTGPAAPTTAPPALKCPFDE